MDRTVRYSLLVLAMVGTANAAGLEEFSAHDLAASCSQKTEFCTGYLRAALDSREVGPDQDPTKQGLCYGQIIPEATYALERIRLHVVKGEAKGSATGAAAKAVREAYPCG